MNVKRTTGTQRMAICAVLSTPLLIPGCSMDASFLDSAGQEMEQVGLDLQNVSATAPGQAVEFDQNTGMAIGSVFGPIGAVLGGVFGLLAERRRRQAKPALAQTLKGMDKATNTGDLEDRLAETQDVATKKLIGKLRAS